MSTDQNLTTEFETVVVETMGQEPEVTVAALSEKAAGRNTQEVNEAARNAARMLLG